MKKAIFAIFVFIGAIIIAQPIGIPFIIVVENIPNGDNGDIINAQCWNFGNGNFKIIVSPEVHAIGGVYEAKVVSHEIGHCVNWDGDEAYADDFANSIVPEGEPIVDKYHNGRD